MIRAGAREAPGVRNLGSETEELFKRGGAMWEEHEPL